MRVASTGAAGRGQSAACSREHVVVLAEHGLGKISCGASTRKRPGTDRICLPGGLGRMLPGELQSHAARRQGGCRLLSRATSSPRTLLGSRSSAAGGFDRRPFKDDVGLVADGAPDADAADILTGCGEPEMIAPPSKHRLAAARPAKQKDALLARKVDLHFVHRKGASVAKRFNAAVPTSPPPTGYGAIIRTSA